MTMTYATFLRSSPLLLATASRPLKSQPLTLVEHIQTIILAIPESNIHSSPSELGNCAFPGRTLLALLTYCYATDLFSASDVRRKILADDVLNGLFGRDVPDERQIRRFRKLNRSLLEHCLAAALVYLEFLKPRLEPACLRDGLLFADEAKRRILMAACLDSVEIEDEKFCW